MMKLSRIFLLFLMAAATGAKAGNKIKYYFNHPVDNTVSNGMNAVYLNNCMGDTLVAYINRAKYTLDIAVYNYTSTYPSISTAINAAQSRGVRIRWIYDSGQSNTGLPSLSSSINKLPSPSTSAYTIMHNKFMVVDANSPNPADAIVWTGSSNWNAQQFNYDYNNVIVLQDQLLAKAYRAHFEMMWGDTGIAPNSTTSKFGQFKTDLGQHNFTIDGEHVELYFSPADGTNSHILSSIASANKDMYFGMYTFTYNTDASNLVAKASSGVYVAGIEDVSSNSSSPYSILTSGLGSNFKTFTGTGFDIYHNKFLIVDPSDKCSDPLVLTGSHNWSFNADTKNDENTLIIHNDTAANTYYQSFRSNFTFLGGTLTAVGGCGTAVPEVPVSAEGSMALYPNPATGSFNISYQLPVPQSVSIDIYDMTGRKIVSFTKNNALPGTHTESAVIGTAGLYLVVFNSEKEHFSKKITIVK